MRGRAGGQRHRHEGCHENFVQCLYKMVHSCTVPFRVMIHFILATSDFIIIVVRYNGYIAKES